MHVKGFTARHPEVPARAARHLRRAWPPSPRSTHLTRLGVTAVELLPVHHFVDERHLVERGLTNYWGYNSIGFFAPRRALRERGARASRSREFKTMVKALHRGGHRGDPRRGLQPHRARATTSGPTLSFRGIDNAAYYRLAPDDPRYYMDYTGCGNTLNMTPPADAAAHHGQPALLGAGDARGRVPLRPGLRPGARAPRRGPPLRASSTSSTRTRCSPQVKLIAEPWDLGEGGYQVGNFPVGWAEWNGKYRDTIRRYWKGD